MGGFTTGLKHMASGEYKSELLHGKDKKNPSNILDFKSQHTNILHPTQKPVALFEYLIKTYTKENEIVLDFTAGSGTTAIACLNTNRQFIVMEKEQKYYDIILKRVGDFNKNFEPQTLIDDISNKLYSGIDSNVEQISYTSLNFKAGMFKQVAFSFFEDDKDQFDSNLNEIATLLNSSPDTVNYVCDAKTYDYFVKCLGMIKKDCKIKSGSVALMAMCEITIKALQEERAKKLKTTDEI